MSFLLSHCVGASLAVSSGSLKCPPRCGCRMWLAPEPLHCTFPRHHLRCVLWEPTLWSWPLSGILPGWSDEAPTPRLEQPSFGPDERKEKRVVFLVRWEPGSEAGGARGSAPKLPLMVAEGKNQYPCSTYFVQSAVTFPWGR